MPSVFHVLSCLLALSLITACSRANDANTTPPPSTLSPDEVAVSVDVVNYNHDRNYGFTLYDQTAKDRPAINGGGVWPLASGGNISCCIRLPKTWRPGLKVSLVWDDYIKQTLQEQHSREMEIPHYTEPGNLYIAFMPNHEVQLVVSPAEPGHPAWTGSIKQTPWNYCVAQHGRKVCKGALPKMFSPKESQGLCTYVTRTKKFIEACDSAMNTCLEDYEDEAFCKSVLWGKEREE